MTSFVGKGGDIARALDNALLFCDEKAEFLPSVVLMEFSPDGISFAACDDYATGQDSVGTVTEPERHQLYLHDAQDLIKTVRPARTKSVTLTLDTPYPGADFVHLVATVGDEETRVSVICPDANWSHILPLMEPSFEVPDRLPSTVAFNAARLARFGRVKGAKDAPVDIRFHPTDSGAPIALVKIGPTFRGELQGVRRDEAMAHLGEGAEDCFWSGKVAVDPDLV